MEAENAAKEKKRNFGGKSSGAMATDNNIYFDDFARKQESPLGMGQTYERTRRTIGIRLLYP
jgi:hypothetical protein